MGDAIAEGDVVGRYLELGLRLGRHVDGFVDAYYGPPALADRVDAEPVLPPARLAGRLNSSQPPKCADSTRAPFPAATARASFAFYNTRDEVDALAAAVRKVLEVFR